MIKLLSEEIRRFAESISEPKIEEVELYVIPGYDSIETPEGEFCFALYSPEEKRIVVAEGVSAELKGEILHHIAHEYYHHIQHMNGIDYDEDEAEKYAEKMLERWGEK